MTTNNKISNLVSSQLPFFVRNDHPTFIKFIEAYYEYLEQNGKAVDTANSFKTLRDIDDTLDEFTEKLFETFLKLMPQDTIADKKLILKNVKDFYRARGTEKSIRFLMRALFNEEIDQFYYPQRDVLRASDGKWFVEKSIKLENITLNNVADNSDETFKLFSGLKIVGQTSGAYATVEKADTYFEAGVLIRELKLSNQYREFTSGETIRADYILGSTTLVLRANIISGFINTVTLTNAGTGYSVGDTITIESNTGSGGLIIVSSVTSGGLRGISVVEQGAGFQANNSLLFTGGNGTGANGVISAVAADGTVHPNSYNIVASTISLEVNTPINNAQYSNLVSSIVDPANNSIANSMNYFVYGNTGPIFSTLLINTGTTYTILPTITAQANTLIRDLGILGRLEITNPGGGYAVGDMITFSGGLGAGAVANVTAVDVNGSITQVKFVPMAGHITGGTGYSQFDLPTATVVSGSGSDAVITVKSLLGYGENLQVVSDSIGAIRALSIVSKGSDYQYAPTLNLSSIGDGTAQAFATIISGTFIYPGRYINDDGHLSSYNFLQNRDYYQNFSYVIRLRRSVNKYRKALRELLHPAGMKMFGENIFIDNGASLNLSIQSSNGVYNYRNTYIASYVAAANANATTITITTGRNTTGMTNVYLEFASGNSNLTNAIYTANIVNTSTFRVFVGNTINNNGTVYYTRI